MRTPEQASVKKTRAFLEKLGLSYDKVSPATQKYVLDMSIKDISNPETIAGTMIGMKFNNKVNAHMSGGRISFPIEYFGTPTNNYVTNPMTQDLSVGSELARAGLSHTMPPQTGGKGDKKITMSSRSDGFLDYSDYKKLESQYEKKFMRKLTIDAHQKKALIDSMNHDIEKSFIGAVKENTNGALTKTALSKNLKKEKHR
jgi:hypothetical protein